METVNCEVCGKTLPKNDAIEFVQGFFCDDCLSEFFVRCKSCDDLVNAL